MPTSILTKRQKAELRRLAALAHERELSAVVGDLQVEFQQWQKGEINVFALNESIHKFHHGISRDLYKRYDLRDIDWSVAGAIARGTLLEQEVDALLLDNLAGVIAFFKEREKAKSRG